MSTETVAEPRPVTAQAAKWWAWRLTLIGVLVEVLIYVQGLLAGDAPIEWSSVGSSALRVAVTAAIGAVLRMLVKPPADLAPTAATDELIAAGDKPLTELMPATSEALEDLEPALPVAMDRALAAPGPINLSIDDQAFAAFEGRLHKVIRSTVNDATRRAIARNI